MADAIAMMDQTLISPLEIMVNVMNTSPHTHTKCIHLQLKCVPSVHSVSANLVSVDFVLVTFVYTPVTYKNIPAWYCSESATWLRTRINVVPHFVATIEVALITEWTISRHRIMPIQRPE